MMAKCKKCGRSGFLLEVSYEGLCDVCVDEMHRQEEERTRQKELALQNAPFKSIGNYLCSGDICSRGNDITIIQDQETGVQYLIIGSYADGLAITPRLKADGTPMIGK